MKVYALCIDWGYDGEQFVGVYVSKSAAVDDAKRGAGLWAPQELTEVKSDVWAKSDEEVMAWVVRETDVRE